MKNLDINQNAGSAARTLRILQYIADRSQAVPLVELSTALDLPKPTVHRLCQSLIDMGMISRDVEEKAFLIGPSLRKLAINTLSNGTLSGLRHIVLTDLVNETGETCNFTILDGGSVLYLDRVETKHAWRLTIDVGERVPIHCTASGKLFLALMPAAKRNYILKRLVLSGLTENTITDLQQLRSQFEPIVDQGHSADHQEFVIGLIGIAVPVFDKKNNIRAAIATHAPTSRVSIEEMRNMLPPLKAAALRMGELI